MIPIAFYIIRTLCWTMHRVQFTWNCLCICYARKSMLYAAALAFLCQYALRSCRHNISHPYTYAYECHMHPHTVPKVITYRLWAHIHTQHTCLSYVFALVERACCLCVHVKLLPPRMHKLLWRHGVCVWKFMLQATAATSCQQQPTAANSRNRHRLRG